jgi:hypothetical protein
LGEFGISFGQTTPDALYHRVHRAWQRLVAVIDPYPYPKHRLLTKDEWEEVQSKLDHTVAKQKKEKLHQLCNRLLEASYGWALGKDPDAFAGFNNIYCIDATLVPAYGKRGTTLGSKYVSREANAGWYTREGDHRDTGQGRRTKIVWGYEATLAVLAADSLDDRFPRIVLGIGFGRPGVEVAEHARRIFASVVERNHQPGWVVADRAYLPDSKDEKLQIPLREMGFELCFDYTVRQLGISESYRGAIQVEGGLVLSGDANGTRGCHQRLSSGDHQRRDLSGKD